VESQRLSDRGGAAHDIVAHPQRSDERRRWVAHLSGESVVPLLPLLADVDRVEEVRRGAVQRSASHRTKVGNWNRFFRGCEKEHVSDWHVHGPREVFQLLEGWLQIPGLPVRKLGESQGQALQAPTRSLSRPRDEAAFYGNASHTLSPRTSILPVTAAEMRAVRYSLSRSMASWTLAIKASIRSVSRSRTAAMADCSADGGWANTRSLTTPWAMLLASPLPPLSAISIWDRNTLEFIAWAKNLRCDSFRRRSRKTLSHRRRRERHWGTNATEPTSSGDPLARDINTSPSTISSRGSGIKDVGRALCSDSTNTPRLTQPAFNTAHSSSSAS